MHKPKILNTVFEFMTITLKSSKMHLFCTPSLLPPSKTKISGGIALPALRVRGGRSFSPPLLPPAGVGESRLEYAPSKKPYPVQIRERSLRNYPPYAGFTRSYNRPAVAQTDVAASPTPRGTGRGLAGRGGDTTHLHLTYDSPVVGQACAWAWRLPGLLLKKQQHQQ